MESSGPSLASRALALVVLLVVGYLLLKVVIGIVAGVVWFILVIAAILAVAWAWRTLKA